MVIDKAKENLQKYGKQLLLKTKLDYDEFNGRCIEFESAIAINPKDINTLKQILGRIA